MPRYPEIRICLSSRHPHAWVSAVRQALRARAIDPQEIATFTQEALRHSDAGTIRRVCTDWTHVELA